MINKNIRYGASFVLENSYPEVKDAEIVVTDFNGKMTVGVKAKYYEATKYDDGHIDFAPKQVGDYRIVEKTSTVEEFFGFLKEMLNGVSEAIEEAKAGRKYGDKA